MDANATASSESSSVRAAALALGVDAVDGAMVALCGVWGGHWGLGFPHRIESVGEDEDTTTLSE